MIDVEAAIYRWWGSQIFKFTIIGSGRMNEGGERKPTRDHILHLEWKGYQDGLQMLLGKFIQEKMANVLNTVLVGHSF
jgi:hypothetical protein